MRSHGSALGWANFIMGLKEQARQREQEENTLNYFNKINTGSLPAQFHGVSPEQAVGLKNFIDQRNEAEKKAQQQRAEISFADRQRQATVMPLRSMSLSQGESDRRRIASQAMGLPVDREAAILKDFEEGRTNSLLNAYRAESGNPFASELPKPPTPVSGTHVNGQGQRVAFSATPGQTPQTTVLGRERDNSPSTVINNIPAVTGKGLVKLNENMTNRLLDEREKAMGAVAGLETIHQGRELINSGIITGAGANALVSIGKGLQRAGISIAEDPIANTEAYASLMGRQVGEIIKMFGSGTGLSDADRVYAQKIAGGEITVNEQALKRILNIGEKAYQNVLTRYNSRADEVMNRKGADQLLYDLRVKVPSFDENGRSVDEEDGGLPQGFKFLGFE